MALIDQLDFAKPEHVSVCTNGNQLIIYIKDTNSSIKLTYKLQEELPYPKYLADNLPKEKLLIPYPPRPA